mgnify:CR=1 FL=1
MIRALPTSKVCLLLSHPSGDRSHTTSWYVRITRRALRSGGRRRDLLVLAFPLCLALRAAIAAAEEGALSVEHVTLVHESLSGSEWLNIQSQLLLGLVVVHQDGTAEDNKTVRRSVSIKLQLLSRRRDSRLHRRHGLLRLDTRGLRELVIEETHDLVDGVLGRDSKCNHGRTITK